VVCKRRHDPFDLGGALVFQKEAVVLTGCLLQYVG
jgi:hypothetical protein